MNGMTYIGSILVTIVLLKVIFKIDFKKAKELEENKELEKLTDKFPENIQIAKEMLEMLDNKKVKIEQAQNTKASIYIALTNKILISDVKSNYARIQSIAHECMHSVQEKRLALFNFGFSIFYILCCVTIGVLTVTRINTNIELSIFILLLLATIKVMVKGYLETDAMTKSRYLAEKYVSSKNILNKEEREKLLNQYDEINKFGIPYILVRTIIGSFLWILLYTSISIIL